MTDLIERMARAHLAARSPTSSWEELTPIIQIELLRAMRAAYEQVNRIERDGQVFKRLGTRNGMALWPIDEFITRYRFTDVQANVIRQANDGVIEEGTKVLGLPADFPNEKYFK